MRPKKSTQYQFSGIAALTNHLREKKIIKLKKYKKK